MDKQQIQETTENKSLIDGRLFGGILAFLIIYSVITFSIETLPNLSDSVKEFLWYSEVIIVSVFTAEYVYRLYSAKNKLKFMFSFYGIVDILSILPFYLALAVDLRSLRLLRLFRFIRLLKLARYNNAMNRFGKALYESREELVLFIGASFILIYLSAVGIYYCENEVQPDEFSSIIDSLWWAIATLTTLGGDISPKTILGNIFTFIILIIGLGLIAVPTGIIASSLSAIKKSNKE